ncbi:MAG TPA: hypothetical protein VNG13_01700 [Mycobacteriales bacterium]|nr:hypothetical protein [Mycobacteriales bacterium]
MITALLLCAVVLGSLGSTFLLLRWMQGRQDHRGELELVRQVESFLGAIATDRAA